MWGEKEEKRESSLLALPFAEAKVQHTWAEVELTGGKEKSFAFIRKGEEG